MELYSEVSPDSPRLTRPPPCSADSPRLTWPRPCSAVSPLRVGTESSLSLVFAAPT